MVCGVFPLLKSWLLWISKAVVSFQGFWVWQGTPQVMPPPLVLITAKPRNTLRHILASVW